MIPNRRTSPGPSERLTASVSACASIATNRISFFIDRLLSHVALRYVGLPTRSVTYALRIGVGRSILTRSGDMRVYVIYLSLMCVLFGLSPGVLFFVALG